MKRDTMLTVGGSALSVNRSASEYRFVCIYPRARCVDGNTGEMIGLAKFALPGFIPHPASEPISRIVLANRHEYLTRVPLKIYSFSRDET